MPPSENRLVALVRSRPGLRRLVYRAGARRAAVIVRWIKPCLTRGGRVLDLGCGTGNVTELLRAHGFDVTPLDVEDLTFTDTVRPVLYDGREMPFADDTFDAAVVSTVLHHVPRQAHAPLLREAARVARSVIVVEDVYDGALTRAATWMIDSALTLELIGHPHSNRTDAGWRRLFATLGLQVRHAAFRNSLPGLRHALYCLDRG